MQLKITVFVEVDDTGTHMSIDSDFNLYQTIEALEKMLEHLKILEEQNKTLPDFSF